MYEYACIIKNVVDGDTIDVDIDLGFGIWIKDERIRLHGIDTPESRTSDKIEKIFGLYAKEYVENKLPAGSKQILKTIKDGKGKYGRILGDFILEDNIYLVQDLLENRIGVLYAGTKDEMEAAHLENRKFLIETNKVIVDI